MQNLLELRILLEQPFAASPAGGRLLLAREPSGERVLVVSNNGQRRVPVPKEVPDSVASFAPVVAAALRVWERLQLELGDAALVAGEGVWARLLARAAVWQGALPVIALGRDSSELPHVRRIDDTDPPMAMEQLAALLKDVPGCAMADLSGRPDTLDIIFEVLPRWSRLLLAGASYAPLTVDFYNNVHRKGVDLCGEAFDPVAILGDPSSCSASGALTRAFRLLADPAIARECVELQSGDQVG